MDTLNLYLESIQDLPDFTQEPEKVLELIRKMKRGKGEERIKAKQELIKSTLKYIVKIARSYSFNRDMQLELIQAANHELMENIDGYKPKLSSFKQFVSFVARCAFVKVLRNASAVHLTHHGKRMIKQVKKAEEDLQKSLGREPTLNEISEYLHAKQEHLAYIISQSKISIADLDQSLYEDDEGKTLTILDTLQSDKDDPYHLAEVAELDRIMIRVLGARDAELLLEYMDTSTKQGSGTKRFKALYFQFAGKRISDALARQKIRRLKKKLIDYIRRKEKS